jgi:diguanylate cyclase (GGDEF)-like protein/PAS domain S-box-containing protein
MFLFLGLAILLLAGLGAVSWRSTRRLKQTMASFQESEENFRVMVKTIPSVLFKGYADWSVDFFDDKFEQATGYSQEDFSSRKLKWDQIILPEDLESAKEIFKAALKGNRSYVREYRIKTKSGEILWIQERAQIICDQDGMIEYVTGTCSDISKEHEIGVTLEENERNFRQLIESVPSVVFRGYADGSVDFFIDDKIKDLTGYSLEEFASRRKRWTDLILPEDVETCKEVVKAALKTAHKSYVRQYRIKAKSGEVYWIRERGQIFCNDQGKMVSIAGTFSDITEQHDLETKLERYRQQNEMILNSVGEGLFGMDRQGNVTFFNPAALQLTGYQANEVIGQNLHALIHHKRADGTAYPVVECPMNNTLTTGKINQIDDEIFWTRNGEPLPVEYMTTPIKQDEQVVGVVGVFRDITQRKLGEMELKRAHQYMSDIIDNTTESIGIVDAHGVVKKWNKASEQIYGYTYEELRGKPAFDLYADKDDLAKMLIQLRRDGFIKDYEINMKRKNGEVFPASLSIKVMRDETGKNVGSVTVARDLTETKDRETKLKLANEKLQAMVNESAQRNRNMTLLQEMSDVFQSCQTSGETYSAIAHFVPKFFPDYAGALYILNNNKNLFEMTAIWGEAATLELVFGYDECWSLRRSRAYLVGDSKETMNCRHVASPHPGSYLCVPMMAQGEIMGIFHLRKTETEPSEVIQSIGQFATTVAEAMAMALANLKLRETLRNQAIRDGLTGLFNRRYMEETLERELSRGKRQGNPMGVIMMDLDHFKEYNDTYGHNAGDDLLCALGQLIQEGVRREDIACRYGGEEFLLIMPGAPLEVSLERANDLCQAVKKLHMSNTSLKPITISAGVAIYPEHGGSGKDVIRAADAALYRAKEEGRDRVIVAQSAFGGRAAMN